MERKAVNPWDWSQALGYHQAEIITGMTRQVICAGQTSVDGKGRPCHAGDMRGQIGLALDNLESVLAEAGMGLGNVIRLVVYSTDMEESLKHFDSLGMRFGRAGYKPPMSLIGVTGLAVEGLMVEIEATAAD